MEASIEEADRHKQTLALVVGKLEGSEGLDKVPMLP
jgi:hypothetical protein